MGTFYFVVGLILFVLLIVVHELGHALVARRSGVQVNEFGIGFPPRAWARKLKNGTLFSINWLPIGGFVRLKGEHDAATGPHTYGGANLWVKTRILLAGVVTNWLVAVFIFTILALVGLPKILPNQFSVPSDTIVAHNAVLAADVVKGSPAERAGLKSGDKILSIANHNVASAADLLAQTAAYHGQAVQLQITRDGKPKTLTATLNTKQTEGQGYLGVATGELNLQRSTWSAPIVGAGITVQFTYETIKGLAMTVADLFVGHFSQAGQNVAGPVGVVSILKTSSDAGFSFVLFLIGVISLTLAVMNALPIPALDGGRLFVTLLYRALRRPLTKKREESIQAIGFTVLMALVLLITITDVGRFIIK